MDINRFKILLESKLGNIKTLISEEKNDEIIKIQTDLVNKGYNIGLSGPNSDGIDGVMGPKTKLAYEKEFGKSYGDEVTNKTNSSEEINKTSINDYGEILFSKNKTAPLLMVYGGINVGGKKSGVYMWDYVNKLKNKYTIFVANDHKVNGLNSYKKVLESLKENNITPSSKILYLFSGGYKPGKELLNSNSGDFSEILLVDIWMGGSVGDFYKKFVKDNSSKVKYYYTSFGSQNDEAKNFISKLVSSVKNSSHMETNTDAVNNL